MKKQNYTPQQTADFKELRNSESRVYKGMATSHYFQRNGKWRNSYTCEDYVFNPGNRTMVLARKAA